MGECAAGRLLVTGAEPSNGHRLIQAAPVLSDAMIEQPPVEGIARLQWVHSAAWLATAAALFGAGVIDGRDGGGDVSVWFALAVVAVTGAIALFVVRYYRRRPLEEAGLRPYAVTVLFRTGASLVPAALGLALGVAAGSWWVTLFGASLAGLGLLWSLPTATDYSRHRGLAVDTGPPLPKELWGAAPPEEVAPWDDEHGHGHGLVDY